MTVHISLYLCHMTVRISLYSYHMTVHISPYSCHMTVHIIPILISYDITYTPVLISYDSTPPCTHVIWQYRNTCTHAFRSGNFSFVKRESHLSYCSHLMHKTSLDSKFIFSMKYLDITYRKSSFSFSLTSLWRGCQAGSDVNVPLALLGAKLLNYFASYNTCSY